MVLEQLLNEIVEIFEHVHLSRKRPHLYQNKSIYACEDIPRLSFQILSDNNNNQHQNIHNHSVNVNASQNFDNINQ